MIQRVIHSPDRKARWLHFDSMEEALRLPIRLPKRDDQPFGDTPKRGRSWAGLDDNRYYTWQDVCQAIREGETADLSDIRKKLAQVLEELPPLRSYSRRRVRGDWGDDLDVGLALAGQIDRAWTRRVVDHGSRHCGPVVTLAVNCCYNSSVSAETLRTHAATVAAITEALEESGRRVEIYGVWGTRETYYRPPHGTVRSLRIKAAEDPLDLSRIVTVCGPRFFRNAILRSYHYHAYKDSPDYAYGRAWYSDETRRGIALTLAALGIEKDRLIIPTLARPDNAGKLLETVLKGEAACE